MDISNWVLILTTLLLAATAFLAPYIIERWKNNYRKAVLEFSYKHEHPFSHLTKIINGNPVYYFRIFIENNGKSHAEQCEVIVDRLYKKNIAGKYTEIDWFTPTSLKWTGNNQRRINIHRGGSCFCDLGYIIDPIISGSLPSIYKNISKEEQDSHKFNLCINDKYISQWDCLPPGNYKIDLSVYCNNADKQSKSYYLSWSGNWKENEKDMFNEIIISDETTK